MSMSVGGQAVLAQTVGLKIDYTVTISDPSTQQFHISTDIKNINHPALSVMESAMRTLWPVLRPALYDPIERPACFQPSGQPGTVQGLEQPLPAKALSLAASVPAAGVLPDSVVKVAHPCPSPLWIPKVTS